jgi:hypothetical protein
MGDTITLHMFDVGDAFVRPDLTEEASAESPEYRWKEWPENCPECGGPLEVFTEYVEDGWANDRDTVRCVDPECGTTGLIFVGTDQEAWATFPDWK